MLIGVIYGHGDVCWGDKGHVSGNTCYSVGVVVTTSVGTRKGISCTSTKPEIKYLFSTLLQRLFPSLSLLRVLRYRINEVPVVSYSRKLCLAPFSSTEEESPISGHSITALEGNQRNISTPSAQLCGSTLEEDTRWRRMPIKCLFICRHSV